MKGHSLTKFEVIGVSLVKQVAKLLFGGLQFSIVDTEWHSESDLEKKGLSFLGLWVILHKYKSPHNFILYQSKK